MEPRVRLPSVPLRYWAACEPRFPPAVPITQPRDSLTRVDEELRQFLGEERDRLTAAAPEAAVLVDELDRMGRAGGQAAAAAVLLLGVPGAAATRAPGRSPGGRRPRAAAHLRGHPRRRHGPVAAPPGPAHVVPAVRSAVRIRRRTDPGRTTGSGAPPPSSRATGARPWPTGCSRRAGCPPIGCSRRSARSTRCGPWPWPVSSWTSSGGPGPGRGGRGPAGGVVEVGLVLRGRLRSSGRGPGGAGPPSRTPWPPTDGRWGRRSSSATMSWGRSASPGSPARIGTRTSWRASAPRW